MRGEKEPASGELPVVVGNSRTGLRLSVLREGT
jgi:hypothetical protein